MKLMLLINRLFTQWIPTIKLKLIDLVIICYSNVWHLDVDARRFLYLIIFLTNLKVSIVVIIFNHFSNFFSSFCFILIHYISSRKYALFQEIAENIYETFKILFNFFIIKRSCHMFIKINWSFVKFYFRGHFFLITFMLNS